jgi:hypothetical protein
MAPPHGAVAAAPALAGAAAAPFAACGAPAFSLRLRWLRRQLCPALAARRSAPALDAASAALTTGAAAQAG